jgi:16S rRNA processing protein RimM
MVRRPAPRELVAGVVGRPHGLDGSFHVRDGRASMLAVGAPVVVAGREARIDRRAGTDERPIVRLSGCASREAVERLRGERLLVPGARAPALEEDEWYAEELEGCRVLDGDREVGEVRRMLALPSCEVLEVARPSGGDLLVPLIRDAVRSVDVGARRIDVDLAFLGEEPAS